MFWAVVTITIGAPMLKKVTCQQNLVNFNEVNSIESILIFPSPVYIIKDSITQNDKWVKPI